MSSFLNSNRFSSCSSRLDSILSFIKNEFVPNHIPLTTGVPHISISRSCHLPYIFSSVFNFFFSSILSLVLLNSSFLHLYFQAPFHIGIHYFPCFPPSRSPTTPSTDKVVFSKINVYCVPSKHKNFSYSRRGPKVRCMRCNIQRSMLRKFLT